MCCAVAVRSPRLARCQDTFLPAADESHSPSTKFSFIVRCPKPRRPCAWHHAAVLLLLNLALQIQVTLPSAACTCSTCQAPRLVGKTVPVRSLAKPEILFPNKLDAP
ncbi:unnamed protein product [Polarella glacialis]|uniref:Uncharacterized protein n=1 Tax=Polarella glacialis TaxID=89957 RepID=A0A813KTK4_POLGL|nr:unnamed protein product [Polarella glacialis]